MAAVVAVLATLLVVVPAGPAGADADARPGTVDERPRDAGVHVVDGEVRSVAQVGGAVVLGGSFTEVGPVTRGAVGVVDAGHFQAGFPDVVGAVSAVVPDGGGGWYLGGSFSSVGGVARQHLAQVDAAGQVTAFAPQPNGPVLDLAVAPAGLLVGGSFTSVGGVTARGAALVDASGATVWDGAVTGGTVRAVAVSPDGSLAYVGGEFSQVGGTQVRRLAALDAATGARAGAFAATTPNQPVTEIVVRPGGAVLVAGSFTTIGGASRVRLAQLDGATGAVGPLNVAVNGTVNDVEVDEDAGVAYLGGAFGQVGGTNRNRFAAVDLAGAGAVTPLAVPGISGTISAVALDGAGGVFVGGAFQVMPEKDNPAVVARISIATATASAVVPYAETPRSLARPPVTGTSGALALVRQGSSLLVAGDFSDHGTTSRPRLVAYDVATGALIDGFAPTPDGEVHTVKASPDGRFAYVGGAFATIAGQVRRNIAKLDVATGQNAPGFQAAAGSYVKDMAVRQDGGAVYVGGNFDTFNGVPASRLVAIDPGTGTTLPRFDLPLTLPTNDDTEGGLRAMALSPDGSRLMVIGNFRRIAGLDRPLIAQIDVSTPVGAVTAWRTTVYDQPCARSGKVGFMRDIDISPDGTRAYVVSAGHFYYPACDSLNAFPMAPGGEDVRPLWTNKIGDTLESVAADRDTVYLSGHFRYLETETKTQPRFQIAAIDARTGAALSWAPSAGGFRGVLTLELEPAGLLSGSDGDAYGVVNHGRNAFWPNPAPGIQVRTAPSRPWVLAPGGAVTHTIHVQNTSPDRSVTLTGLVDQRMGNLAGSGTCALSQTVAPGGVYTCTTAGQQVTGAAPSAVTSIVTATGTAGGATVTATDRSTVQVIAAAPAFRIRAVAGPGQVSFPGQVVRFSVTMMNLDVERPTTLSTLTSPTFGDLTAECGLPRPVAPNGLVTCHVDRLVEGPVGSKPSHSFTATATYDTGALTSSSSQTVTIAPPVGGTKALAVVANPAAPSASDKKVTDFVEDGYAVTYADDNDVTAATVPADASFVILYPSAVDTRLGTRLRELDLPVLVLHSRLLDEMGMAAVGGASSTGTQTTIVRPMHPLSTTLSGVVALNRSAAEVGWAQPAPTAQVVSQLAAGQATEFAYAPGAAMATGTAAACRVFFGGNVTTQLTTSPGWVLFNRAAAYTAANCGGNMLWTAAGNGQSAYGTGDGRQSVTVGFSTPWGIAIDAQDRVYVADAGTHAVRRVDPDGTVVTVAGTGTAGGTGDGGPATAARLNAPSRLALDVAGNLYIADSGNHRIRRVTPAGAISTVAGTGTAGSTGDGGPATAARLRNPYDVAVAPDGTMYIADRGNHKVREVTPAGTISTVAGTGTAGYNGDEIAATTARLNNPYGVAVDPAGDVYIADHDNERVRVVDTAGVIRTFAGTGVATADGDGGPAAEAGLHKPQHVQWRGGDLLISEANGNRVRIVHEGVIDTLAGSGQFGYVGDGSFPAFSTWQRPSATATDSHGNLWIVDRGNRRVRVINRS